MCFSLVELVYLNIGLQVRSKFYIKKLRRLLSGRIKSVSSVFAVPGLGILIPLSAKNTFSFHLSPYLRTIPSYIRSGVCCLYIGLHKFPLPLTTRS
jgi:hypothetical protein